MSNTTQADLPIKNIKDDLIILRDGSIAAVLQTTAVNFDLLSETEQLTIISAFAGLINSLSFPIQIIIRSRRLDISSYLNLLAKAEQKQSNPLLSQMMERYRIFIETIIRENEVLDKQFYVQVTVSYLEVGLNSDIEKNLQKALNILLPRIDHIMRQLGRIGLRTTQLDSEKLIRLFYDEYNETEALLKNPNDMSGNTVSTNQPPLNPEPAPIPPSTPEVTAVSSSVPTIEPNPPVLANSTPLQSEAPQALFQQASSVQTPSAQPATTGPINRQSPFVVEELGDEYKTI